MATSHLMPGWYIPQFGLNSLIFLLSFGEIFSYTAPSRKWCCLAFWIGKKSRLFERFFQYSVICYSSKYIRLALTDFNKNRVFYRNCMWLQLSQILNKFTEENARKFTVSFAFYAHVDVIKYRKDVFLWACADCLSFRPMCANAMQTIGSHLNKNSLFLDRKSRNSYMTYFWYFEKNCDQNSVYHLDYSPLIRNKYGLKCFELYAKSNEKIFYSCVFHLLRP